MAERDDISCARRRLHPSRRFKIPDFPIIPCDISPILGDEVALPIYSDGMYSYLVILLDAHSESSPMRKLDDIAPTIRDIVERHIILERIAWSGLQ